MTAFVMKQTDHCAPAQTGNYLGPQLPLHCTQVSARSYETRQFQARKGIRAKVVRPSVKRIEAAKMCSLKHSWPICRAYNDAPSPHELA